LNLSYSLTISSSSDGQIAKNTRQGKEEEFDEMAGRHRAAEPQRKWISSLSAKWRVLKATTA
jgi:hypothetical protein